MRIAAREKLGYLTGDTSQPSKFSSTYNKWCTKNFRVNGWLIDSMSLDVMSRLIRLSTAKEIWDAMKKPTLMPAVDHLSGDRSPHSKSIHCDADMTERQTELDCLRVHFFLVGLDPQFDQVWGEILHKIPN
ncbi:hypothetical protein L3X38_041337 [Prunus dulcis]|uniref:Uncharacterized protein n=1 Tax=Prunus dulcis TaxID=3755 RepID=A0AAD4USW1_PRUDU|nr:hypothetical protein L3X38_041337 [Prunus dulcis]